MVLLSPPASQLSHTSVLGNPSNHCGINTIQRLLPSIGGGMNGGDIWRDSSGFEPETPAEGTKAYPLGHRYTQRHGLITLLYHNGISIVLNHKPFTHFRLGSDATI